jgi:NADPH-dependent F420 reductase
MGESSQLTLGLLGGTGKEGSGLALRLALAGFAVQVGSRTADRAVARAAELKGMVEAMGHAARLTGNENTQVAASSDLVFLNTPFPHAAALLEACRPAWRLESVVVDVTVPVNFETGKVQLEQPDGASGSEFLARRLPQSVPLIAAFKTIPAHLLADLHSRLDCDVFVCGDAQTAKVRVMEMASSIEGLRVIDAGPLREARTLEHMSALAMQLNRRYKIKAARFRVVGV